MADGHLNFDTKINEQGFNQGISKLRGLASKGMAVVGAAAAAGVAAFGMISKASLDSVASLEQNVGGIKTLFEDSADVVINNAKKAYMTAGLSANDYMATVTSFSASLLQSLGQDTVKAADYANRAVVDMSDNANKMGTSMEMIQNAYQGFAKQNYTMLDNLKLGYGGTKEEMARLIKDAAAMTDVQEKLGISVDESSMSFGNIVNAISVMQNSMDISGYSTEQLNDKLKNMSLTQEELTKVADSMGISYEEATQRMKDGSLSVVDANVLLGTTAREAATTIEGSMNAAKAAWDNLLNGSGDAQQFADAVSIAAENIIRNLGEIVPRLLETIPAVITGIATTMSGQSETLLAIGTQVVSSLIEGIVVALPNLLIGAVQLIQYLADMIAQNLPTILDMGVQTLTQFMGGISQCIPGLWESAVAIITALVGYILANLPTVLETGLATLGEFINGILQKLPEVISSAGVILNGFLEYIFLNLPAVLESGIQLVLSLVDGIIQSLPEIISSAVSVVGKLLTTVLENAPKLIQGGLELIAKLIAGIIEAVPDLIAKIPGIIKEIKEEFTSIDWGKVGRDILSGIANGIVNGAGTIVEAAKNAAERALSSAKDFLGIHSPSRVFRDEVGKMMALGIGVGFEKNIPIKSMNSNLQKAVNRLKKDVVLSTSATGGGTVGGIRSIPGFEPNSGSIDYKKLKQAQKEALNEANKKPVILNGREIDRATKGQRGGLVFA